MTLCDDLPMADRRAGGRLLAADLDFLRGEPDLLVLGLPRGGVPVAFEIARALAAPLDMVAVRKLGLPQHPEYAFGALAAGGVRVMHRAPRHAAEAEQWESVASREAGELARREHVYRQGRPPQPVEGRTVVLADDGAATGATLEAAARAVRAARPRRLVIAVPVASREASARLAAWADTLVVGATPAPFGAVGNWYLDFGATPDSEVLTCLNAPVLPPSASPAGRH